MIYLDNAATTKPHKTVVEAMVENMEKCFGNPSSIHSMGVMAEKKVNGARESVARIIGSKPEEIYFTGGGTEANNLALMGAAIENSGKRKTIITSVLEHKAVLKPLEYLKNRGYIIKHVNNDGYGNIDMNHLEELIDDEVFLVSIMHVNNEIGVVNNIRQISNIIKTKNKDAIFHVDGIQSFGKIEIDVKSMGIDMLSISAHKAHGPKGVGVLYLKSGFKLKPLILGGGQEKGLRSGTENIPGIAGFDSLCRQLNGDIIKENCLKAEKLQKRLVEIITEKVEFSKVISGKNMKEKSPYITSIAFNGIMAEVLVHSLEIKEVYISTGSACNAKNKEYSHVLNGLGLKESDKMGTVRISISSDTTPEELETGANIIVQEVLQLSKIMRRGN